MIIYKVTNIVNNKIYIGQTVQPLFKRWHCHQTKGNALYNAIKKYGKENFTIEQIDSANSIKELNEKEIYWIKELNILSPNGYNLRLGGNSGGKLSEETKQKVIAKLKGRPVSEKTRKIKSKQMLGEKNPMFGKSPNWGRKYSQDTIEKIRQSNIGKKRSKEFCEKLSELKKGNTNRLGKKFGHQSGKKNQYEFEVFNKVTGEFIGSWSNQRICAEDLKINYKNIYTCLSGRRPSCNGYIFTKKEVLSE